MKRLLVILAFVAVVLGALVGGVYLVMSGESSRPRKPVVAKEADALPETSRDNGNGPLGAPGKDGRDASAPGKPDAEAPRGGDGRKPDRPGDTSPAPDRTPVKPPPTDKPERDVTKPVNPDGTETTDTVPEIKPVEGAVTISGRVVDDAGGPVAGASVMFTYTVPVARESRGRSRDSLQTVPVSSTDNEGYYQGEVKLTFPHENGALTLNLWAQGGNGLRSEERTLEVKPGDTHANIDFALARGGELSGRVVNHRFEGVAGAKVTAQPLDKRPAVTSSTDGQGYFKFTDVRPGEYRVLAVSEGYQSDGEPQVVTVSSGAEAALGSDLKLKPKTALKLRLVSQESQPVGAFTVIFHNADGNATRVSANADAEGNALVTGVPEDAVEVQVEMRGYQPSERMHVSVIKDDHTDVGEVTLTRQANDEDR